MNAPLMPKATAIWLIDNTTLTFEQIGEFCKLHPLEVQALADGDIAVGIIGHDPVSSGQITFAEIARCEADPSLRLKLAPVIHEVKIKKRARYTPVALRQAKPDGIAWLLKEIPNITDADIIRIIGTTKPTIQSIRERTHQKINDIKPVNPIQLGLCSVEDLNEILEKYKQ